MDPRADALIAVVQTNEFLHSGMPVDTINDLIVSSKDLYAYDKPEEPLSSKQFELLISNLKKILKK